MIITNIAQLTEEILVENNYVIIGPYILMFCEGNHHDEEFRVYQNFDVWDDVNEEPCYGKILANPKAYNEMLIEINILDSKFKCFADCLIVADLKMPDDELLRFKEALIYTHEKLWPNIDWKAEFNRLQKLEALEDVSDKKYESQEKWNESSGPES